MGKLVIFLVGSTDWRQPLMRIALKCSPITKSSWELDRGIVKKVLKMLNPKHSKVCSTCHNKVLAVLQLSLGVLFISCPGSSVMLSNSLEVN